MKDIVLFDTHAHLYDVKFDFDRDEVVKRFKENGIKYMLNPACDLATTKLAIEMAEKYEDVYASVGYHPDEAGHLDYDILEMLEFMAKNPKVKAVGEIGFDFYHNTFPRDVQEKWFVEQIKLAKKLNLPIVIHDRDSNQAVFDVLVREKAFDTGVVMHSYSGSKELAKDYVKRGAYISISGPVTYSNARVKQEVVASVPLKNLLIETDSPYLTPVPRRGQRNEPAYVRYVAEKMAEIRGVSLEEIAEQTTKNALDIFRI